MDKMFDEKETPKTKPVGLPTVKITTKEKNEWIKAGMPNINKWLKEFRARS